MDPTTSFEYQEAISVLGVRPSSGSVKGGAVIEVRGHGFGSGAVQCAFGSGAPTMGSVASPGLARCVVPAVAHASEVRVEVSRNGADFSRDGPAYRYVEEARAVRLEPSRGPEAGGVVVTVIGAHFANSETLSCRVGGAAIVRGAWRSTSAVECVMPARRIGNTTVEVQSRAGMIGAASRLLKYMVDRQPLVSLISPSRGPVSGGTRVTVGGLAFHSEMLCEFGGRLGSRLVRDVPALAAVGAAPTLHVCLRRWRTQVWWGLPCKTRAASPLSSGSEAASSLWRMHKCSAYCRLSVERVGPPP
jgi:hypothetical protein